MDNSKADPALGTTDMIQQPHITGKEIEDL